MSVTEQELEKAAVAPRVTLAQVEETILHEYYFTGGDGVRGESLGGTSPAGKARNLEQLTFCVLVLKNGYTVTGQSACADPANYNVEIGKRIARSNAVNQIWGLLGYELKTKLDLVASVSPVTGRMAKLIHGATYLGTKVVHAAPMTLGTYNMLRGWKMPENEDPDRSGYLVEYTDGGETNVEGFAGYVSWSPSEVFDRSYQVMKGNPERDGSAPWIQRAKRELAELVQRFNALGMFLKTESFSALPPQDRADLTIQHEAMGSYMRSLVRRLGRATA